MADDKDRDYDEALLALILIMTAMEEGDTAQVRHLVDEFEKKWKYRPHRKSDQ